jgi:Carboxypeptidase regulatory-like domain
MLRYTICVAIIVCASLFTKTALAQAPGSISGTVRDQTGKPLSGIWVTALRTSLPPARATVASSASGGFVLTNLPEGTYRICAQSSSGQYLDPCWWSDPVVGTGWTATARSGQATAGIDLQLQAASALQLRINDPQFLLDGHPERTVMAGVITKAKVFLPAFVKSADASGRTLQVSVPPNESVQVTISGVQVALIDATGVIVPAGGTKISLAPSQANPLTFTVSGLAPIRNQ